MRRLAVTWAMHDLEQAGIDPMRDLALAEALIRIYTALLEDKPECLSARSTFPAA